MFMNCIGTDNCEYDFGDCDLFSEQACSEFVESRPVVLVEKEGCEEVSLEELSCYGLPPFDESLDETEIWIQENQLQIINQFHSNLEDVDNCSDDMYSATFDESTNEFHFEVDRACFETALDNYGTLSFGRNFRFEVYSDETTQADQTIFFLSENKIDIRFTCSIATRMEADSQDVEKNFS
ncbi:Oidioi.mRNA.OKI2018_I69.chr2.g5094.t1.cds [Oikopleura dioica]|uniref:Oidioi.mRNA.OKI2018_I69.chr2.g5094.t1.cds n=1 Tax=Oikopleura dioica TaxID=34765 RepID=A0ABN7T5Y3_OIKDI|nr:Oidioi.mRNA.OKI2018_I69.chr2.g5094.t1.cds [Oikopleura dioica]